MMIKARKPRSIDVTKMLDYLQLMIRIVDAVSKDKPLPIGLQHVRDNADKFAKNVAELMQH